MKVPRASDLGGAPASKEVGWSKLPLTSVKDGEHVLKLIPPSGKACTTRADPTLTNAAKLQWRPLSVKLTLAAGKLTAAQTVDPTDAKAVVNNGYVGAFDETSLAVDMKPDWVRPNITVSSRAEPDADAHRRPPHEREHHQRRAQRGAERQGARLRDRPRRPHREVRRGLEGHLARRHEQVERHRRLQQLRDRHRAREQVGGVAPRRSTSSLLWLLEKLTTAHSIAKHRVVGHSDIRCQDANKSYLNATT